MTDGTARLRRLTPWIVAVGAPVLLIAVAQGHTGLFPTACVILLAVVVLVAMTGHRWPALLAAALGALALNWGFTVPLHSLRMRHASDAVMLVVFVVMAVAVSVLLDRVVARAVANATGQANPDESLDLGDWLIDFRRQRVLKGDAEVPLTPTEWSFLELLARNVGRLVTREEILSTVWGAGYRRETNYLRVYINQLRQKLEDDPATPRHLITTHGVGYTLER